MEKTGQRVGLARWAHNAGEALRQIGQMVVQFPSTFKTLKATDKLLLGGFVVLAAGTTGGAALLAGPVMAGIQGAGFAFGALSLMNQRLQYNHNKMAIQPIISGGSAVQQLLLGGFGYAVMSGIAGTRAWVFSMLPEDPKYGKLRTGIALGFAAAGVAGITALSVLTGRYENMMTIPSMLMGTTADRMPSSEDPQKDHTRYARLLRTVANLNNTAFNVFVSHSAAGALMDSIGAVNLKSAIDTYDVPVQHNDGRKMSPAESLRGYFNSLLQATPPKGKTPHMIKTEELQALKL